MHRTPVNVDVLHFNLFAVSEVSSVSSSSEECTENIHVTFQNTETETLQRTITQFAKCKYNRSNIGALVAGFVAFQSRAFSIFIPCDIHSIVFQFYYEEENEVLHFSEKVFRTLCAAQTSSSPSSGEFTGNQLMQAVQHCVGDEAVADNIHRETLAISHKLLQFKYIEMVAYVSSFSSLFSADGLQIDDEFDDKHRYKFAANRIDQYLCFSSSESESE